MRPKMKSKTHFKSINENGFKVLFEFGSRYHCKKLESFLENQYR